MFRVLDGFLVINSKSRKSIRYWMEILWFWCLFWEKICDFCVDEKHIEIQRIFKYLPIRFQWRVRRDWDLGWLFWQSQHQLQGCSVLQMIHQWWKVFCLCIEGLIRWIQQGISRNLNQLRRRSWQVHLCQPERTQCQQASQRRQH